MVEPGTDYSQDSLPLSAGRPLLKIGCQTTTRVSPFDDSRFIVGIAAKKHTDKLTKSSCVANSILTRSFLKRTHEVFPTQPALHIWPNPDRLTEKWTMKSVIKNVIDSRISMLQMELKERQTARISSSVKTKAALSMIMNVLQWFSRHR
nr:hypothetical protein Iba_chr06bCG16850 [Ipomoea batatas]GMD08219.1 hypothetical protein Iba_chr06cCG14610 [Ipomoea batatas]GMD09758.1 hypothetical protein Iba_chr06dCG11210 [Ipomoea batatas]GME07767.1 hypothetical protein Iba_scaffold6535CG0190 [Ipomoea batatas]